MGVTPNLLMTANFEPLKRLQKQSPELFQKAMAKGGIQFLNWANNGSRRESRKPPIRFGVLRGSSSVFVGDKLVSIFPITVRSGAKEKATPAKQHNGKALTLTFVWNTNYATKMHEHNGNWGEFTEQDGDAGNKWLELHLMRDREDLMEFIKKEYQSSMEKV